METRTGQTKGSDVVLELLHALEEKDYDRAATFLSNDFTFSGPTDSLGLRLCRRPDPSVPLSSKAKRGGR